MSTPRLSFRPALQCLHASRNHTHQPFFSHTTRCFSTTPLKPDEALATTSTTTSSSLPPPLTSPQTIQIHRVPSSSTSTSKSSRTSKPDGNLVSTARSERRLIRLHGVAPVGSRRRRAAMRTTTNIPFEELPYQCFQEARKILSADRALKLAQIAEMRKRIQRVVEEPNPSKFGGEIGRKAKLVSMQKHLEDLKILADINDPVIKKRFEDGEGTHLPASSSGRTTINTSPLSQATLTAPSTATSPSSAGNPTNTRSSSSESNNSTSSPIFSPTLSLPHPSPSPSHATLSIPAPSFPLSPVLSHPNSPFKYLTRAND